MAFSIPLQEALLVLVLVPGMLMLMVWQSWLCLWPGGNIPSQDRVACLSACETVSLWVLQGSSQGELSGLNLCYLFLCPASVQGLENQEACAVLDRLLSDSCKALINHLSQLSQLLTSLLDDVQLEQLAVETFFSPSFLLASSSAAATSISSSERDSFTSQISVRSGSN